MHELLNFQPYIFVCGTSKVSFEIPHGINILPIHWKICVPYNGQIFRALRFKQSRACKRFWNSPHVGQWSRWPMMTNVPSSVHNRVCLLEIQCHIKRCSFLQNVEEYLQICANCPATNHEKLFIRFDKNQIYNEIIHKCVPFKRVQWISMDFNGNM